MLSDKIVKSNILNFSRLKINFNTNSLSILPKSIFADKDLSFLHLISIGFKFSGYIKIPNKSNSSIFYILQRIY